LIADFDSVLSLDLLKEKEEKIEEELINYINGMIEKRNKAKQEKNYKEADRIREELKEKGIIIKDTKEGTIFEINK
jgi:cysteinyl-tRNA synthetase